VVARDKKTQKGSRRTAEWIAVSDNVIYSVTSLTVLVDVATLLLDAAHDDADALILIVANILSLSAPDIVP
jgi:hypothetical protein